MKEEKTVKVKRSFTQKVDLQMCRQRQLFANLYKSRCSGLDTNGLVLWLMVCYSTIWCRSIGVLVGLGLVGRHYVCIVVLYCILFHLLFVKEKIFFTESAVSSGELRFT
jgi:hypothetical protein